MKAAGCLVMSSATTVAEARWLEARGCDVVIAQGNEAGGHRGMFLTDNLATQVGTFALVPQIVDAVKVPVIATGGIADARGIVGGAGARARPPCKSAPPICSARNSNIRPPHRAALNTARDDGTVVTNLMTGRPARGFVNRVMRELGRSIATSRRNFRSPAARWRRSRAKARRKAPAISRPCGRGRRPRSVAVPARE